MPKNHAPAPWVVVIYPPVTPPLAYPVLCRCESYGDAERKMVDANRNGCTAEAAPVSVFAAAPKLYAALEFALEFLRANDDGEEDVANRISSAETALREAKGE
jgi:hypothetical protein